MASIQIMKRMNILKLRFLSTILIAIIGIVSAARADTIHLKDGTKFEAEVEFQNDQLIRVRVLIVKGISETRILQRSEVEKIVKTAPDDEAFIEVQKMVPSASLLTLTDYQELLEKGPDTFLKTYPESKHVEEALKIKETLELELEKVQLGNVKLGERWFTKEEQDAFNTIYRSEVHLFKMKEFLKRRRYIDSVSYTHLTLPTKA